MGKYCRSIRGITLSWLANYVKFMQLIIKSKRKIDFA
jgi:hypothetical protein